MKMLRDIVECRGPLLFFKIEPKARAACQADAYSTFCNC